MRALLVVVTMDSLKDCAKDDAKEYGLVARKAVEQVGHWAAMLEIERVGH
jgi:hypothetical protein